MGAIDRKLPLASEIALITGFGMGGNKGYEQPTVVDPLVNLARSHASPPRSSLWSSQTSMPAARSAAQIRWAASASCEA
jgi:hypothetical protein